MSSETSRQNAAQAQGADLSSTGSRNASASGLALSCSTIACSFFCASHGCQKKLQHPSENQRRKAATVSLLRWDLAEVTPAVKGSLLPRISGPDSRAVGEPAASFAMLCRTLGGLVAGLDTSPLEFKIAHWPQPAGISRLRDSKICGKHRRAPIPACSCSVPCADASPAVDLPLFPGG